MVRKISPTHGLYIMMCSTMVTCSKLMIAPNFVAAMENKINRLWDMLEVVPRSTISEGSSILPAIWAFKRKRLPDWSILKHKARLNVHGG